MRHIDHYLKPKNLLAPLPPLEAILANIDRASVRTLVKLRLERLDAAFEQGIRAHEILLADSDTIAAYAERLHPDDSKKLYVLLHQETHAALAEIRHDTLPLRTSSAAPATNDATTLFQRYQLALIALAGLTAFIGISLFLTMALSLVQ
ncbi:hypothetical protein ACQV9O_25585 [Ralstonia pseudosolanacearum]